MSLLRRPFMLTALRVPVFVAVAVVAVLMPFKPTSGRLTEGRIFAGIDIDEAHARAASARAGRVAYVIDGDTVVLNGGVKVRYLGIDTPEAGEPFYEEAKTRNMALVEGVDIRLEVCKEEPRDKYDRLLAYVYAGKVDVGATLLREGLARPLTIPPCGVPKAAEFKEAASEARAKSIGVWGAAVEGRTPDVKAAVIAPWEARRHAGEVVTVTGIVSGVHKTTKAVFIDFGPWQKRVFTAVLFKEGVEAFRAAGIDPAGYIGNRISVTGRVKLYGERAEIIVSRPSQIK